jgi:hypothetical protein
MNIFIWSLLVYYIGVMGGFVLGATLMYYKMKGGLYE